MSSEQDSPKEAPQSGKVAYDFSFKTLMGEKSLPLKQFEGQVLLIVNTASLCGFTPQYEDLEELYTAYKKQGLIILGVPSNDFGNQEPGTNAEIDSFCKINYGVSFPMASKEVVSGEKAHPFYIWAKEVFGNPPQWNFHKYLVDRRGHLVDYFNSTTSPRSQDALDAVEKALAQEA